MRFDPASQDVGNIVLFEHVNLTVPNQETATDFYVDGLGFTRDPYLMVGTRNMWVNCGRQQFHLPKGDPQRFRGVMGLVVPNLDALENRLHRAGKRLEGTRLLVAARRRPRRRDVPVGKPVPGAPGRRRLRGTSGHSVRRDADREGRGRGGRAVLPLGDGRPGRDRGRKRACERGAGTESRVPGRRGARRRVRRTPPGDLRRRLLRSPSSAVPTRSGHPRGQPASVPLSWISSRRGERRCCSPSSTRCGACITRCTGARS